MKRLTEEEVRNHEAFTAAYMAACKDRSADWNEIGYWYARQLWEAAVKHEREQSSKLADALMHLLGDTQHAKHPSCTDGGYCPVRDAREALAAFTKRIEGTP